MNASHASHARSSEEADMRLLRFRRGTESLTANAAPAVLGAMAGAALRCGGRRTCTVRQKARSRTSSLLTLGETPKLR